MRSKIVSLLAVAFGLGVAQAASAADMPTKAPILKAPVVVAAYNWTGCYVGGNGGWKGARFHGETADTPTTTATLGGLGTVTSSADSTGIGNVNSNSGAFGGQVGCRWETTDHWVWGFEGDFDWTNVNGSAFATPIPGGTVFIPADSFSSRMQWESSIRAMLGHSWDRVLLYATGGVAFASVKMDGNYPAAIGTFIGGGPGLYPASSGSQTKIVPGVTVGVGGAYAIDNHWEFGAEYRFTAYQKTDFALGTVAGVCGISGGATLCTANPVTGHMDLQTHEVLLKLNYKFN